MHSDPDAAAYSAVSVGRPSVLVHTQKGTGPAAFTKYDDRADSQARLRPRIHWLGLGRGLGLGLG